VLFVGLPERMSEAEHDEQVKIFARTLATANEDKARELILANLQALGQGLTRNNTVYHRQIKLAAEQRLEVCVVLIFTRIHAPTHAEI
jgi:hypothetical protein